MLGWRREKLRSALKVPAFEDTGSAGRIRSEWPTIIFDITDIAYYVVNSRWPTGIQRIQLAVLSALIAQPPEKLNILFSAFSRASNYWTPIANEVVKDLVAMTAADGRDDDPEWKHLVGRIEAQIFIGPDLEVPQGARLVNLGSSWAMPNYFLAVRRAKLECNLIYVPFIHDCIPIIAPQYFVSELGYDFREWLRGVFDHADGILTSSNSTAKDLDSIAIKFGYKPPNASRIRLDGKFEPIRPEKKQTKEVILNRYGVEESNFILFVSTIEPRKNHKLVFQTWLDLIHERGIENVPTLVCVGGRGWKNESALDLLNSNPDLQKKIKLFSNVSDTELDVLYSTCLFTLYPSRYEGWGLPVTESLVKGKVPLVSRISSLPEAGLDFAEYFDLSAENDFREKLEVLLNDRNHLSRKEKHIIREFRPRPWIDIAHEIIGKSLGVERQNHTSSIYHDATFYSFSWKNRRGLLPHAPSAERFRAGTGWAEPDEKGCWITDEGMTELVFTQASIRYPERLHLYLLAYGGAPASPAEKNTESLCDDDGRLHRLNIQIGKRLLSYQVEAERERWILVPIEVEDIADKEVRLQLDVLPTGGRRNAFAVGIKSTYLCEAGDTAARLNFVEGIALGAPDELANPHPIASEKTSRPVAAELALAAPHDGRD
ncbi:glycosyltransferase family 4 protein [Hyphomicrobium sp. 2TAF46]|uniref:glycosyltransferase family 4 protein n=1 Tax=Hyphomicrobium sp. 2TAF46 TaxID=3233019 RepID=UPI003F9194B0